MRDLTRSSSLEPGGTAQPGIDGRERWGLSLVARQLNLLMGGFRRQRVLWTLRRLSPGTILDTTPDI